MLRYSTMKKRCEDIESTRTYCRDSAMEFVIIKCAMLILKKGKCKTTKERGLFYKKSFMRNKNLNDQGISEVDSIKDR